MTSRQKQMVFDLRVLKMRPRQCQDCGWSKAVTIWDTWELMKRCEGKTRCLLHNCMKDPDDLACADFLIPEKETI